MLIAVRVHLTKSKTFFHDSLSLGGIPSWFKNATSSHAGTSANTSSSKTTHLDGEGNDDVDLIPSPDASLNRV